MGNKVGRKFAFIWTPSASKAALFTFSKVAAATCHKFATFYKKGIMIPRTITVDLPLSIDEAVTTILNDLPLLDRTRLSAMSAEELHQIDREVGAQIARDFRLWSGNDILLSDCLAAAQQHDEPTEPTLIIIHALWQRLQETHVLRLLKP